MVMRQQVTVYILSRMTGGGDCAAEPAAHPRHLVLHLVKHCLKGCGISYLVIKHKTIALVSGHTDFVNDTLEC